METNKDDSVEQMSCLKLLLLLVVLKPSDSCKPQLQISTCENPGGENERATNLYYDEEVSYTLCPKTKMREIVYGLFDDDGLVQDLSEYDNRKQVILADIPRPGSYYLIVKMRDSSGAIAKAECNYIFLPKPPKIRFNDKPAKYVKEGAAFDVDITTSKDLSSAPQWSVRCERKAQAKCEKVPCNINSKNDFKFSSRMDPCFTLMVFTASCKYYKHTVKEELYVIPEDKDNNIKITCTSNCDYKSIGNQPIGLKAECIKDCGKFARTTIQWSWAPEGSGGKSNFGTSPKMPKTANLKGLAMENRFRISASSKQYNGEMMVLTKENNRDIKCEVSPLRGVSLKTVFTVECKSPGDYYKIHKPYFEVYHVLDKQVAIFKASQHMKFSFVANSRGKPAMKPYIRYSDESETFTGSMDTITLDPLTLKTPGEVDDLIKQASKMLKDGNIMEANTVINGMLMALEESSLSDAVLNKAYMSAAGLVGQMKLKTMFEYITTLTTLKTLFRFNADNYVYEMILENVCQKTLDVEPDNLYVQAINNWKLIMDPLTGELDSCGDLVNIINETAMYDNAYTTQPPPPPPEELITEEYDDYEEDSEPDEKTLLKVDGLNLLIKSTRLQLRSRPRGEVHRAKEKICDRKMLRESAGKMDQFFEMAKADVITASFEYKESLVDTIVLSCPKTLLDPDSISSNIVSVTFHGKSGHKITGGDFMIEFRLDIANETFQNYGYSISSDSSGWVASVIDYVYNVHRIHLHGGSGCLVKFFNLTAADKFMIVFTTNIRPTYGDFHGTIDIVDEKNPIVNCRAATLEAIDRFVYMAVLPHKDMIARKQSQGSIKIDYNISINEQVCLAYDEKFLKWSNSSCKARYLTDREVPTMECICDHTTFFAASLHDVESKLDPVYVIKYQTRFLRNYVIIAHVLFVFTCYLIALSFLHFRATATAFGRDNIIYMSDNRKNDRYAYFIIVKTGSFPFSGTTSNVTIKLFGERADTLPHVLNYPDPNKRLLQRDRTDWFILTNDTYLGNVHTIEVWIDSIGYRPSWYCENITLLDLQKNAQLFFKVNKWLSVVDGAYFVATTKITTRVTKKGDFVKNVTKSCRFHNGAENTWNIFSRTEDDFLTYSQRLTIILSMIYTTYTIIIFLTHIPEMRLYDAYGKGRFHYQDYMLLHAFYASAISSLVNLPFVYFFRNSCKHRKSHALILETAIFGVKVTKIIWYVLVAWILLCAIYLVIFGFWIPYNSLLVWAVCTVIALGFSVLVVENVYILVFKLVAIYLVKVKEKIYNIVKIVAEIERQRKTLYKKFGEMLMRPYFRKHYYKMPFEAYIRKKKQELVRSRITHLFRSLCVYLIFLASLYTLIYIDDSTIRHHSNVVYHQMLNGEMLKTNRNLKGIDSNKAIIDYMNKTLYPVIFPARFYAGFVLKDPGLIADYNSKILGVARLRQQRKDQTCTLPDDLYGLSVRCVNKTLSKSRYIEYIPSRKKYDYMGVLNVYMDGGYNIHLGRTAKNMRYMLKLIKQNKWLDLNTHVAFIEFLTFNPNCNLFNSVRVTIERDLSGNMIATSHVVSFQILHSLEHEILLQFLIGLFVLTLAIMAVNLVLTIMKLKLRFIVSLWNVAELIVVVLSINIIAIIFERKSAIEDVLARLLDASNNKYVNYNHINHLSEWLQMHLGFLAFIATLNFWKYVRFAYIFQLLERSIYLTGLPLLGMAISQMFLFVLFCIFYYLTVGNFIWPFWCLSRSITSIVLISLNFMKGYDRGTLMDFGLLYTGAFMVFMMISIVCFNMYCTILMVGFVESKEYFSNKKPPYTLKTFLRDELKFKRDVIKAETDLYRLKGGGDEEEPMRYVTAKEPAKRYANCLLMTDEKLDLMKYVAISVIKGLERMKHEYDLLDFDILVCSVAKRLKHVNSVPKTDKLQQNVFFREKDPNTGRVRFVNNLRMLQMEYALEEMLHPKVEAQEIFKPDILHMTGDAKRLRDCRDTITAINKVLENIDIKIH